MTLLTSALKCAVQLGRANAAGTAINDLAAEIKDEIGNSIRFYNRQPWHLTEVRAVSLTTAAGQTWYSSMDVSAGAGDQSVTGRTATDTKDILNIQYGRENPGSSGLNEPLLRLGYKQFEALFEGSTPSGPPTYWSYYAGQVGIWPTPDDAYTLYFSATVKPLIPTQDVETSVWLDEQEELINAAACKRVAIKHLRDPERAAEFAAIEASALSALQAENLVKTSSGRLRSRE